MARKDRSDKAKQEKAGDHATASRRRSGSENEAEAPREKAFKERRSESAIVRETLRRMLGFEDKPRMLS